MRTSTVGAAAAALCAACGLPDAAPDDVAAPDMRPRGTYVLTAPSPPSSRAGLAAEPWIFYLNRAGGTYTPGRNDARTNRSSLVERARAVPPWDVSDEIWGQVVTCLQDQFARWNVVVTDVDPGDVPHLESVIAGDPTDIDMDPGVGGVSPYALDCSTIDNSIVFTFAEVFGRNARVVCEVAAQEMAHSFGLDHERLCTDPMTYMSGCGRKTFQDQEARCGEDEDRDCACGDRTQNSVAWLTERLGLAEEPPDAGVPDARPGDPPRPDAGPSGADAGSGSPSDAAAAPATGEVTGTCAAGGGGAGPAAVLVAAGLVVGIRRKRRA